MKRPFGYPHCGHRSTSNHAQYSSSPDMGFNGHSSSDLSQGHMGFSGQSNFSQEQSSQFQVLGPPPGEGYEIGNYKTNYVDNEGTRVDLQLHEVFEGLYSKHFPSSTKWSHLEQLCTTLEEAYWDYKDLYAAENPDVFPPYTFKQFVEQFFAGERAHQPPFNNFKSSPREMVDWYIKFKLTLHSYGAILLNSTMSECVLVRGCGSASWGFPRGKAKYLTKSKTAQPPKEGTEDGGASTSNSESTTPGQDNSAGSSSQASNVGLVVEKETPVECAIREVYEELGLDISAKIDEKHFINAKVGKRKSTFFIVPNISKQEPFAPQLRNEIEEIQWKKVDELVHFNPQYTELLASLKSWIAEHKPTEEQLLKLREAEQEKEESHYRQLDSSHERDRLYPGISHKLRKLREGCKRCPLCGLWFMPSRRYQMAVHMLACAQFELDNTSGSSSAPTTSGPASAPTSAMGMGPPLPPSPSPSLGPPPALPPPPEHLSPYPQALPPHNVHVPAFGGPGPQHMPPPSFEPYNLTHPPGGLPPPPIDSGSGPFPHVLHQFQTGPPPQSPLPGPAPMPMPMSMPMPRSPMPTPPTQPHFIQQQSPLHQLPPQQPQSYEPTLRPPLPPQQPQAYEPTNSSIGGFNGLGQVNPQIDTSNAELVNYLLRSMGAPSSAPPTGPPPMQPGPEPGRGGSLADLPWPASQAGPGMFPMNGLLMNTTPPPPQQQSQPPYFDHNAVGQLPPEALLAQQQGQPLQGFFLPQGNLNLNFIQPQPPQPALEQTRTAILETLQSFINQQAGRPL
jgi:8-oxo-dGTP pyrophosphatase MutT (NUDIX family)